MADKLSIVQQLKICRARFQSMQHPPRSIDCQCDCARGSSFDPQIYFRRPERGSVTRSNLENVGGLRLTEPRSG